MSPIVIDDHLLRDVLTGDRTLDLGGLNTSGVATTGLWLFRLSSSLADPTVAGRLSRPVNAFSSELQARFRVQLAALPAEIEVLSLRDLAWAMGQLQQRHRAAGRALSATMVEALAAAHRLDGDIAVSALDVGPNLQAAAEFDGISFHVL